MPTGSFQRVSLLLISEIFIAHLMETKNNLLYFFKKKEQFQIDMN